MELTNLFSSGKIGSVQIKNRIVRSATLKNGLLSVIGLRLIGISVQDLVSV